MRPGGSPSRGGIRFAEGFECFASLEAHTRGSKWLQMRFFWLLEAVPARVGRVSFVAGFSSGSENPPRNGDKAGLPHSGRVDFAGKLPRALF